MLPFLLPVKILLREPTIAAGGVRTVVTNAGNTRVGQTIAFLTCGFALAKES